MLEERLNQPMANRLDSWIQDLRKLSSRAVRKYESLEEAFQRMQTENPHLSEEQARHLTIHGSNQNEDGTFSWKFDNYVRAFPPTGIPFEDQWTMFSRITCPTLLVRGLNHGRLTLQKMDASKTLKPESKSKLLQMQDTGFITINLNPLSKKQRVFDVMSDRARRLHSSKWTGVFYITGGGSGFLSEILQEPGIQNSARSTRALRRKCPFRSPRRSPRPSLQHGNRSSLSHDRIPKISILQSSRLLWTRLHRQFGNR